MLANVQCQSLLNNFDIISSKFPRAEIMLVQSDIDEGWNNFEIILFHINHGIKCEIVFQAKVGYLRMRV